jgi:hypothetical protein
MEQLQTALVGAAGASTTVLLATWLARNLRTALLLTSPGIFRVMTSVTIASWTASWMAGKRVKMLDKQINKFIFEDYIHADKD